MSGRADATPAPLVGRHAEMAFLRSVLDQMALGDGRAIVVEGEPGIGKTRLVDELVALATGLGWRVFSGGADELEQSRPFGVVVRTLGLAPDGPEPARAAIGRLLHGTDAEPPVVEPGRSDVRYRVVDRIVDLVESEAATAPVLIALEDVHWADASSILLIAALGRRVPELPVVMVLTARPGGGARELVTVLDRLLAAGAAHLPLAPLGGDAVTRLVADLVEGTPGPRLLGEAGRAGGNPWWVGELVRSLCAAGAVRVADGLAEMDEAAVLPAPLRTSVLRRLRQLSQDARRLLTVASVLGSTFDVESLALGLGGPTADLLPALTEAREAGVLGDSGHAMTFRHDLLRQVLYEDLSPTVRRSLHRDVGRALARAGRPASEVAVHIGLGAMPGDVEAVRSLQLAARESAPGSPSIAAGLLEQALALVEPSNPRHDEVAAELVAAWVRCGRASEAEALARDALRRTTAGEVSGRLRWGLAEALQLQGRLREALDVVEVAARDTGLPAGRRARLLADAALWRYYTGDRPGAEAVADEAVKSGEEVGDAVAVCLGLAARSRCAVDALDLPMGIDLARESLRRLEASPDSRATDFIHPTFDVGGALVIADELAEAEDVLRNGRRLREQLGSTWDRPLFTNALAHVQLYRGNWDDALAEAHAALRMIDDGAARGSMLWTYALLGYVAVHRGELDTAAGVQRAAESADDSGKAMGSDLLLWCQALVHEANGDGRAATDHMEKAWELPLPFKVVTWPRMAPDAVRLAKAAGRTGRAEAVARDVTQIAQRTKLPLYRGIALRCAGLLENDVAALQEAVDVLGESQRPFEMAAAAMDAGAALERAGRRSEAVALFEGAVSVFEHVGAARDVAAGDAALRRLGRHRGRRGPRARPKTGWDSLTPTERRVLDLAANGLTNSQIGELLYVSPRTVETHLSHLYRKLGIRSRTQLAAAAAGRGR